MTIRLPIKYKSSIIEDSRDFKHYMSLRTQLFRFRWMQHHICVDMNNPESLEVNIEIPSMEEHEELPDDKWKDIAWCDLMHFHILNHLHMRLKIYMETEFYIKAHIRTDFEFEFTAIK